MNELENGYLSPDGFKISAELGLTEFLNHKNDDIFEYVHVIPDADAGEIRVYRSVRDDFGPKIMTTVPGRLSVAARDFETPDGLYLTGGQGETLLTLLRCYRNETTAGDLTFEWWGRNNSQNMDHSDMDNESLIVTYKTGSNREQRIHIDNAYKNRSNMMATGDRYKFPN